jgi:ribosomal protein S12 methylthiotransferase
MNPGKINIVTLGCSKNIVDSEKLLKQISAGGYEIIYDSDDTSAGTVIINTCGFINDAREESIDTILRFVRAKEEGLVGNLYVMGCLSEIYMNDLKAEIPEVNRYFGVHDMQSILNELGIQERSDLIAHRTNTGPSHYAYLKVSEGCDRTCSFCSIPRIRGRCISRPVDELTEEARILAGNGVKELILVAQDLSYYGMDLYRKQMLPDLVLSFLKLNLFEWIRLHYLYPAGFPHGLFDIIRDNPEICRYVDIPVQHISDHMLSLMRRSHGRDDTVRLLSTIRERIPEAAIRTTLIAGHPGESERDFNELKEFVRNFKFDRLGVFAYSHEEGTYSFKNFKDNIPDKVKKARVSEIMEIQQDISATRNRSLIGQSFKTIADRREGSYFLGRTEFDSPGVDQEILIPERYGLTPGDFYNIRITDSSDFDLFGYPET